MCGRALLQKCTLHGREGSMCCYLVRLPARSLSSSASCFCQRPSGALCIPLCIEQLSNAKCPPDLWGCAGSERWLLTSGMVQSATVGSRLVDNLPAGVMETLLGICKRVSVVCFTTCAFQAGEPAMLRGLPAGRLGHPDPQGGLPWHAHRCTL